MNRVTPIVCVYCIQRDKGPAFRFALTVLSADGPGKYVYLVRNRTELPPARIAEIDVRSRVFSSVSHRIIINYNSVVSVSMARTCVAKTGVVWIKRVRRAEVFGINGDLLNCV
jgi:hypothetical protein